MQAYVRFIPSESVRSLTFSELCVQLSQFFKHWRRQGRFWRLCHTCGSWLQQRFCNKKEEIYDIKWARQQLFDCVYVQLSSDRARNTPESHVTSNFLQATQRSTGLHYFFLSLFRIFPSNKNLWLCIVCILFSVLKKCKNRSNTISILLTCVKSGCLWLQRKLIGSLHYPGCPKFSLSRLADSGFVHWVHFIRTFRCLCRR